VREFLLLIESLIVQSLQLFDLLILLFEHPQFHNKTQYVKEFFLLIESLIVETLQLFDLLVLLLEHPRLHIVHLADEPQHGGLLHLGLGPVAPAVLVGLHLRVLSDRKHLQYCIFNTGNINLENLSYAV
jgi:hypothetical protein